MNYIMIYLIIYVIFITDATLKEKREVLLQKEARLSLGGKIKLTNKEELVNICLMNYKNEELDHAMKDPTVYNLSYHYFSYKNDIPNSKVYNILKDMPKGAALHVHDMAILGPDYLLKLTYLNHLYMCHDGNILKLKFSDKTPDDICKNWMLVSNVRRNADNLTDFDQLLRNEFTVDCDLNAINPDTKDVWDAFMSYFFKVESLITYRPVWEQYFYDALNAFREENIMYVEVRSILPLLYDLDGTLHKPIVAAQSHQKVIDRFVKDYPEFLGAKLIYTPLRQIDCKTLETYIKQARELKCRLPDLFAGFDLAGLEDLGGPLAAHLEQLSAARDLNFFFHAGETNWLGSIADENLVDAVLLSSKRIGHALNLVKHPLLMKQVVARNIAIEVTPISNMVFYLVKDVRNHPLSIFISAGVPVVLSSDAPGAWEADLLSQDFYVAFVGAASRHADLRLLKALTLNSLIYSAMNRTERHKAISIFKSKWKRFIDKFDCSKYNPGTVALLCRNNTNRNEYCIQFSEAITQLKSPYYNSAVEIINSLSQRRFLMNDLG